MTQASYSQSDPGSYGGNPQPQRAKVRRVDRDADAALDRDLKIVEKLADLLDSKFSVAGIRFGYDSIIGLIPGVGDIATGVLALYPIYLAGRHNLGGIVIARMLANVGIDVLVGTIPLVGDAFDVAFKANLKNVALFRAAALKRRGYRE